MPTVRQTQEYLSDNDIAARLNVHRTTPWRWAKNGTFPKPVKIGPGTTRWRVSDFEAWNRERQSA